MNIILSELLSAKEKKSTHFMGVYFFFWWRITRESVIFPVNMEYLYIFTIYRREFVANIQLNYGVCPINNEYEKGCFF